MYNSHTTYANKREIFDTDYSRAPTNLCARNLYSEVTVAMFCGVCSYQSSSTIIAFYIFYSLASIGDKDGRAFGPFKSN